MQNLSSKIRQNYHVRFLTIQAGCLYETMAQAHSKISGTLFIRVWDFNWKSLKKIDISELENEGVNWG
jgi:hypothetical protein